MQSPHALGGAWQDSQSMTMPGTVRDGTDSQGPPTASSAGPPNSGRNTTSIRSPAPHQRQVTDSTVSASTSVSSTDGSPAIDKCQNSRTREDRTTSKRVRLPQWAQRNRDCSSGRVTDTPGTLPAWMSPPGRTVHCMSVQLTTDTIGLSLREATFVVVDLETTGGAPADAGITEIGAVRIRGGEVIGEFSSLVNPGVPIPPFVAALTGITDAVVATAPPLRAVLPSFLEFLQDAILIAHNAPYDVGFLKGACARLEHRWPAPTVLDTARIARVALHRDEVRNCKLATLAQHFRATVAPTHRAFDDARATADVFHALVARVGDLGVQTVDDLLAFSSTVSAAQRRKRHLADGLPSAPGVYVFEDAAGLPLYVGTSKHIRARVRGYFTASETRTRMSEMITIAERVRPIVCATTLEARVRELRLIAEHAPRYNQRSKRPARQMWLKLTDEAAPRLSLTRQVRDDLASGARYLGPFPGSSAGTATAELLTATFGLRTCTSRLPVHPRTDTAGCALAELGRCLAPCSSAGDATGYRALVDQVRVAMSGDVTRVVSSVEARMRELAKAARFEEAALWRDRLTTYVHASLRTQRLALLAGVEHLVAAAALPDGGWELHCIRYGRLAGAAVVPVGVDPQPAIAAMVETAEVVEPTGSLQPAALTEETEAIWTWLTGARLVQASGPLALPVTSGGAHVERLNSFRKRERVALERASATTAEADIRPIGPRLEPVTRINLA